MNEQGTKSVHSMSVEEARKSGFFERMLLSRLGKMSSGSLLIKKLDQVNVLGKSTGKGISAEIMVSNPVFFRKACLGGSLGVADSYADGDWNTPDLVKVFRLFLQNQEVMDAMESGWARILNYLARFAYALGKRNTLQGSRRNIALHYDLGNEFYESFLDRSMTYSCGIFESPKHDLEQASIAKYDRIIDQLEIQDHHEVLEIGCGWGGFVQRFAQRCQATLTATTISDNQFEYTVKKIKANQLEKRIKVIKLDYRNLKGKFDRIVSIEMIEAVGHEFLPTYFSKISELLHSDGAALIQGITMPDNRYDKYLKEVDYIRTKVFPGSCVPSASAMISAAVKNSDLRPTRLTDFGYHYARTLREWRIRFKEQEAKIIKLGFDEHFLKAWEYYLSYCEAGFEEGYTGDVHLLLNKPGCRIARGFPQ